MRSMTSLKRPNKFQHEKKSIREISAEFDRLDLDLDNLESEEVPNDFICFNVPITQSLNELSNNTLFNHRFESEIAPTSFEKPVPSPTTASISSAASSPVLSDDSLALSNLENNSKAFNVLDCDAQDLTLEFNSNINFLKHERLTQQSINKKKINHISKKLTKDEKFWIKFLNDSFQSFDLNMSSELAILNKEFSSLFNNRLSNYLTKFDIYDLISANNKSIDKPKVISRNLFSGSNKSRRNSSNTTFSPHGFNSNVIGSPELDFVPNTTDNDFFNVSNQSSPCFISDVRYKKKYALPNNNSVDTFDQKASTTSNSLQGAFTLYSVVNATDSTISLDSVTGEFSGDEMEIVEEEIIQEPIVENRHQNRQSINSSTSTPRSSILSANSISSIFSSFSPIAATNEFSKPISAKSFTSWWSVSLSISPLPPLLLKFSLVNNGCYVNDTIDSMSLRSIIWYLSNSNHLIMNKLTFDSLSHETNDFVNNFEVYLKVISEIENSKKNMNNSEFTKLFNDLKVFLNEFKNIKIFQNKLLIFRSINNDVNSLKIKNPKFKSEESKLKNDLKCILLNFYFYMFDTHGENVTYNKESISLAFILLTNIKNAYLTFNCLINLASKGCKIPTIQSLFFEMMADDESDIFNPYATVKPEMHKMGSLNEYMCEEQDATANITTKIFIKLLKSFLPDLHEFFVKWLKFNSYRHFSRLMKLVIRKVFEINSCLNDDNHLKYLECFFDIVFLDKSNNNFAYLAIMFLKQYQNFFLHQLTHDFKVGKRKNVNIKFFINDININSNELLLKFADSQYFLNELKSILIQDLGNELTLDGIIEFQQLGIDCE